MAKKTKSRFVVETIKSKRYFDPRSFRTKVARAHRLTFGCPKGYWDPGREVCKVPVELQRILHPRSEFVRDNPCYYKISSKKRSNPGPRKWYVGKLLYTGLEAKVFSSSRKPKKSSYGHLYKHVTGPFKTKEEAEKWIRFMGWDLI